MKIVIRAGGVGTRLWPWSRSSRPKQFLPFFEDRSCVQVVYDRFAGSDIVEAEDVYLSINRDTYELARAQLPELPEDNIIVEPATRDTAAAIGLETVWVAANNPDETIASLGSDHYCGKPENLLRALEAADHFLDQNPGYLMAIACKPTRVETNYGHVKMGEKLWDEDHVPVHVAEEFTEKPNWPTAKRYMESGDYLWNANFFAWKAGTLLDQFKEFEPEMHQTLMELADARGGAHFHDMLEEKYPTIKKTAVDYAILEPASRKDRLAVMPVDMEWSDIGSWSTLTDAFQPDEQGNLFQGPVKQEDTTDTTVVVKNPDRKVVAVLGLEDIAVVDTEDALLVCRKDEAAKVKKLVQDMGDSDDLNELV